MAVAPSRRMPLSFLAVTNMRVVAGVSASSSTSMSRSPAFETIVSVVPLCYALTTRICIRLKALYVACFTCFCGDVNVL